MKVYRYNEQVLQDLRIWESEERLYIPGQGVIEYLDANTIDSFHDDQESISRAQKIMASCDYDEFDLPEAEVLQVVALGKTLNSTKTEFENAAKSLIDKIKN